MSKRPEWWLAFLAKIWPITWLSARATHWPVLGPVVKKLAVPLFSGDNFNLTYIPINKSLGTHAGALLPKLVVEKLIRESSHRVLIKRCTCRDARKCENHPVEYGCTLLGEGTKEIDPRIARHVSVDEAIAHLHRTLRNGLTPMTGRLKIDNFIWGVRDLGKLLTICHCCHCCCTILTSAGFVPEETAASLVPLKGLHMNVDPELCVLCGTCVTACRVEAISLENGRVAHDTTRCKGCGRCASVCPENAVTAEVADVDKAVRELTERLEQLVDIR